MKIKKIILMVCLVMCGLFITGCGCSKEKYVVTFNSNGGNRVASQTVEKGQRVTIPEIPTRDGYVFVEWLLDGEKYDFTQTVSKDFTLDASWKVASDTVSYTVTFDSNGGSKIASAQIKEGDVVAKPTNPTKNGYKFVGWYLDGKVYDFENAVTANITLIAKWETEKVEYVVTFDTVGGSKISSKNVFENEKVSKPTNPTKEGHTFVEWQLNGVKYDFSKKVTKNITLKAVWEELAKYTVTFNSDGGSNVASKTVYTGNKVAKPTDPTKEGHTFVEWQLDGVKYDFNAKVTKSITLKAVWEAKEEYTVTFDSDGGSNVVSKTVYSGDKVAKPADPTKTDYKFIKWQLDGVDYDFNAKVTKNITLKAVWEEIKRNYTYTVKGIDESGISPTRLITLYVDGKALTDAKEIYYTNGTLLSKTIENGAFVVSKADLKGLDSKGTIKIKLSNGSLKDAISSTN